MSNAEHKPERQGLRGTRARVAAFVAVAVVAAVGASAYAVAEYRQYAERRDRPPSVAEATGAPVRTEPHIVFRHTGMDNRYGQVATVALDDPGGPRAFTDVVCDRVAAWSGGASCLVTRRGVVTKFEALELDRAWQVSRTHALPGIPSRTRVSHDGRLVATTSFVTGHSYATTGFSTETVVRETGGGRDWGNLEKFALVVDGTTVSPVDRNVWGVTFAGGERFYATVGTGGHTYLVEGDLERRTLTALADGAECPSVSPDGTRVAFKVDVEPGDQKVWGLAVHDLATGSRTVLEGGPRGVDDQVAWLDDDTLMYGLPRQDQPSVEDVWALDTRPDATPRLLIEEAWSPTVVRP